MFHEAPKHRRASRGRLAAFSMALTSFLTGRDRADRIRLHVPRAGALRQSTRADGPVARDLLGARHPPAASRFGGRHRLRAELRPLARSWWAIPVGIAYGFGTTGCSASSSASSTLRRRAARPDGRRAGGIVRAAGGLSLRLPVRPRPAGERLSFMRRFGRRRTGARRCMRTRLRLSVAIRKRCRAQMKTIGARGVLKRGATNVQVIIGPEADLIADEIRTVIEQFGGRDAVAGLSRLPVVAPAVSAPGRCNRRRRTGTARSRPSCAGSRCLAARATWLSLDAVAATPPAYRRARSVGGGSPASGRRSISRGCRPDTFRIVVGDAARRYAETLATPPVGEQRRRRASARVHCAAAAWKPRLRAHDVRRARRTKTPAVATAGCSARSVSETNVTRTRVSARAHLLHRAGFDLADALRRTRRTRRPARAASCRPNRRPAPSASAPR